MSTQERLALLGSGDLLSITEAARLTPYSAEYLSWLARNGQLPAVKIARNWLTTTSVVTAFVKKQKERHLLARQAALLVAVRRKDFQQGKASRAAVGLERPER